MAKRTAKKKRAAAPETTEDTILDALDDDDLDFDDDADVEDADTDDDEEPEEDEEDEEGPSDDDDEEPEDDAITEEQLADVMDQVVRKSVEILGLLNTVMDTGVEVSGMENLKKIPRPSEVVEKAPEKKPAAGKKKPGRKPSKK